MLYKDMFKSMTQLWGTEKYPGNHLPLINHSTNREITLELPSINLKQVYDFALLAHVELADFNKKYEKGLIFTKYICNHVLLFYTFPCFADFAASVSNNSYVLTYYLCRQRNIESGNVNSPSYRERYFERTFHLRFEN